MQILHRKKMRRLLDEAVSSLFDKGIIKDPDTARETVHTSIKEALAITTANRDVERAKTEAQIAVRLADATPSSIENLVKAGRAVAELDRASKYLAGIKSQYSHPDVGKPLNEAFQKFFGLHDAPESATAEALIALADEVMPLAAQRSKVTRLEGEYDKARKIAVEKSKTALGGKGSLTDADGELKKALALHGQWVAAKEEFAEATAANPKDIADVPWDWFKQQGILNKDFRLITDIDNIRDLAEHLSGTNDTIHSAGQHRHVRDLAMLCYRSGIMLPGMPDLNDGNLMVNDVAFLFSDKTHAYKLAGVSEAEARKTPLSTLRERCITREGQVVLPKAYTDWAQPGARQASAIMESLGFIFGVSTEATSGIELRRDEGGKPGIFILPPRTGGLQTPGRAIEPSPV